MPTERRVLDQLDRELVFAATPQRIVSLCPSTTETILALGADSRLVGRTDYCCHPAARMDAIASVGGTKRVKLDRVAELAPDLVVSVREENDRAQIDEIAARWPTLILDPVDVPSAVRGVELLGTALGAEPVATELAASIRSAFHAPPDASGVRALYLIWRKPYMAVGAGTFLHDVMQRLGIYNVAAELDSRYPEIPGELVATLAPDVLLASSEPFPFAETHLDELREFAPSARPVLVDGELFSWHGVRMLEARRYFDALIPTLQRT